MPAHVLKWVKDEPEILRVGTLIGDENELKRSLDEAEEIVRRLERALNGPARVNVFPELATARTKAFELGHELTDVKKELAKRETALISPVAGAEKSQLDALDAERAALESQIAQLPGKAAAIAERQAKARSVF